MMIMMTMLMLLFAKETIGWTANGITHKWESLVPTPPNPHSNNGRFSIFWVIPKTFQNGMYSPLVQPFLAGLVILIENALLLAQELPEMRRCADGDLWPRWQCDLPMATPPGSGTEPMTKQVASGWMGWIPDESGLPTISTRIRITIREILLICWEVYCRISIKIQNIRRNGVEMRFPIDVSQGLVWKGE